MGVMLSPGRNPNITEEEVARAAGHQAGQARKLLLGRLRIGLGVEHHSHSSAPFFQA